MVSTVVIAFLERSDRHRTRLTPRRVHETHADGSESTKGAIEHVSPYVRVASLRGGATEDLTTVICRGDRSSSSSPSSESEDKASSGRLAESSQSSRVSGLSVSSSSRAPSMLLSINVCSSAGQVTGLAGEPRGAQRLPGVASRSGVHEREGRREAGTVERARARAHEREHLLISVVDHMAPGEQKRESAHTAHSPSGRPLVAPE